MWPKILLGAFFAPYFSISLVMVATRYEQWTEVKLLIRSVSRLGGRP